MAGDTFSKEHHRWYLCFRGCILRKIKSQRHEKWWQREAIHLFFLGFKGLFFRGFREGLKLPAVWKYNNANMECDMPLPCILVVSMCMSSPQLGDNDPIWRKTCRERGRRHGYQYKDSIGKSQTTWCMKQRKLSIQLENILQIRKRWFFPCVLFRYVQMVFNASILV